ncbi:hypothetical protein HHI36_010489 [Cryptolaemus montrouzieri]|uniref:Uncharacterized protein n=1 Tax=Cryptolaemus montrouzieri TaxID=559131 RepID=A0ABD2MIS3_9CUCU
MPCSSGGQCGVHGYGVPAMGERGSEERRKTFSNNNNYKLLNFLEQLSSDDECFDQVDKSKELHLTLFPLEDGTNSDQDNGPNEDDEMCRIGDIVKEVLKQKMARNKRSENGGTVESERKEATTTKEGIEGAVSIEKTAERITVGKTPEPTIIDRIRDDLAAD